MISSQNFLLHIICLSLLLMLVQGNHDDGQSVRFFIYCNYNFVFTLMSNDIFSKYE
jgi:hypothetical protein